MSDREHELQFLGDDGLDDDAHDTAPLVGMSPHTPAAGAPSQSAAALPGPLAYLAGSNHPKVAFFHWFFRSAAILVYVMGGLLLSDKFVVICVADVLLLAADFWTVKNVSGRFLVGLRWWVQVREDGKNEWLFESLDDRSGLNPTDNRIFWTGLWMPVVVWALFLMLSILKLQFTWLLIVAMALAMSCTNLYGYIQCSNDAKGKMKRVMDQGSAVGAAVSTLGLGRVLGGITGMMGGAAASAGNNNSEQTVSV